MCLISFQHVTRRSAGFVFYVNSITRRSAGYVFKRQTHPRCCACCLSRPCTCWISCVSANSTRCTCCSHVSPVCFRQVTLCSVASSHAGYCSCVFYCCFESAHARSFQARMNLTLAPTAHMCSWFWTKRVTNPQICGLVNTHRPRLV